MKSPDAPFHLQSVLLFLTLLSPAALISLCPHAKILPLLSHPGGEPRGRKTDEFVAVAIHLITLLSYE